MYDPRVVEKFIEIHQQLTALADAESPPVPAPADPRAAATRPRPMPATADIEVLPQLVERRD